MYEENQNVYAIAEECNISVGHCYRVLTMLGIDDRMSPSEAGKKAWRDPKIRAKLSKLSKERATYEVMSEMGKKASQDYKES